MHVVHCNWCRLTALAVFGTGLVTLIACGSHIMGRIEPPEIAFMYPIDFHAEGYDSLEPAPVEVRLHVSLANVPEPISVISAVIDWGDGEGFQPIDLPYGQDGVYSLQPNYSFELAHTYMENGTYTIDVRMRSKSGQELSRAYPLVIRIGPQRWMFTDPRDGSTYEIYDGTVWVSFTDRERFAELDHEMAQEPDIAAFLEAENLRVRQESAYTGSMEVILPYGATVEEAVGQWPQRYPELIESVEPNSISELL